MSIEKNNIFLDLIHETLYELLHSFWHIHFRRGREKKLLFLYVRLSLQII